MGGWSGLAGAGPRVPALHDILAPDAWRPAPLTLVGPEAVVEAAPAAAIPVPLVSAGVNASVLSIINIFLILQMIPFCRSETLVSLY